MWSVGVLVAGYTLPAYTIVTGTGRTTTRETETLVEVNGSRLVLVLLVPLVFSLLAAGGHVLRDHAGGVQLAWGVTVALCALTAVAMLSIGIFVAPVAVALLVACAAKPTDQKSVTAS